MWKAHADVHLAEVFGRCEAATGIAPFERLVDQAMSQPPYSTARRVFWVMDNGSRRTILAFCPAMRQRRELSAKAICHE